jgi:hypothetical protein
MMSATVTAVLENSGFLQNGNSAETGETPAPGYDSVEATIVVELLVAVHGRGRLKFVASATITISDVQIGLQCLQVIEDNRGHLAMRLPQCRHPLAADTIPAVILPIELHRCLERAILEMIPNGRVVGTEGAAL